MTQLNAEQLHFKCSVATHLWPVATVCVQHGSTQSLEVCTLNKWSR